MSSSPCIQNFVLSKLREPVINGLTRSEEWRRLQLSRLGEILENHENEIISSLDKDLGKPPNEAIFEVIALKQELKLAKSSLSKWMRPKKVNVPLPLRPGEAFVQPEPLGCVLIIGPWNYPFSLTLQPLISALAAGNTAVLKPSEHSPTTSHLTKRLVEKYFPENVVKVFEGDGKVASELLSQPFDHVFFTGGSRIGKEVMKAAAVNLTPVTLELGGKSPAIVIQGADLEITARRIIWGKSINAGQTCIAPDHLLVEQELKDKLVERMKVCIDKFYGQSPLKSKHLGRIVNESHFNRLTELIKAAQAKNQVIYGGEFDYLQKRISPTLIEVANREDPLMAEELFGPILPILTISNLKNAISQIRVLPKPLAIYMFGGNQGSKQSLVDKTCSGSICFNDVVMQAGIPDLPFGGVGDSGMGKYHGFAGFETFSHQKSILQRPFWMDLSVRYPPYKLKTEFLKKILG